MRIGILTTHSVINYGSILQAYALQSTLENMGHEVVVLDRWMSPGNEQLSFRLSNYTLPYLLSVCAHGCLGLGDIGVIARKIKTTRLIRSLLHLTPYHFYNWEESPKNLGVDLVIVGSDQVWNTTTLDPSPYLMIGAPRVPTIAYAASFGIQHLPTEWKEPFKTFLSKFAAIAVREQEGCNILADLNINSKHVIDPSLLADPKIWESIIRKREGKRKKLICYLITPEILTDNLFETLDSFAKKNDADVELIGADPLPFKRSFKFACKRICIILKRLNSRVKIRRSATPVDFVDAISNATWVLTDSFHAVMFSYIFNRNVRFVRTNHPIREKMFARVNEFAHLYINGPAIATCLEKALSSFASGETTTYCCNAINDFRKDSMSWLKSQLSSFQT